MPLRSFHSPGAGFDYRLRVTLLLVALLLAALAIQLLLQPGVQALSAANSALTSAINIGKIRLNPLQSDHRF
jgi:hypothetical protein